MESNFVGLFLATHSELYEYCKTLILPGTHWLYVCDEKPVSAVKENLRTHGMDLENGWVLTSAELKLREQVIRTRPVAEVLEEKLKNGSALQGTVLFLEMSWAIRTPSGSVYLRDILVDLQQLAKRYPVTIYCLYNRELLLDEHLLLGLYAHPFLYAHSQLQPNPYCLPASVLRKITPKLQFEAWYGRIFPEVTLPAILPGAVLPAGDFEKKAYPVQSAISTLKAQTDEGRWKVRCLGELKVYRENGELIDWSSKGGATKKLKAVFAYLLLKGEKGATLEELADLLWKDEADTQQTLNRLYHCIRYLRVALSGQESSQKDSPFIVYQNGHYYLALPFDSWIDLPMFEELCFKGSQELKVNNLEQGLICYESAERLYRGDLFSDIPVKYVENNDNDWCWSRRFWYREMYHKLLYSLASVHRQLGNPNEAIKYADKALTEDPCLEMAHLEKIKALAAVKRMDAVHRQYRVYCESLKKFNMGMPSEAMRSLYLNVSKLN
ncbi:BTAD domain-containing putative transcriptional regulator [Runella slithyformis]|uniref:Response regulator receiver and SARP domain protein n=1 Tax=Runella slithyformis (strain ATCC 29530 / DSM 19594 / LMG 11500 / NCIMB 11436 / LSU 4) TaxID=761193 RepID=A0A7U3ZGR3_RUNSL|nr:BTAD domain-containing putative transcriptional regulator [Runella slithyformis]AEI46895.1 response regulator receiver and SARP domain protein [Runella slithyformis DSM 19594]